MKKSRFTESQIVSILKQAEAGTPVADLCREYGMSSASFYQWRSKYGGMDASLMRRFDSLDQARQLATQWIWEYNNVRPNTAIGGVPPRRLMMAA
jgi:putative transposase